MFAKFRIFSQKFSLAGNPDHKWLPVSKMLLMVFWIKDEQENGFNEKYNYIYIFIYIYMELIWISEGKLKVRL